MRRETIAWVVAVTILLAVALGVGVAVYRHSENVRTERVEQNERKRLWELREKKNAHETYWKFYNADKPGTPPPSFLSDDAAELAELERRAAERAADRAGNR